MAEPARPDEAGICCPRCGCRDLRVVRTMPLPGNRIRRYRVCRACQKRISTVEVGPPTRRSFY